LCINPFALLAFEDAKVNPFRAAKAMQVPLKKSPHLRCAPGRIFAAALSALTGTLKNAFIKGQKSESKNWTGAKINSLKNFKIYGNYRKTGSRRYRKNSKRQKGNRF
jgi:hypothetical protein